MIRNKFPFINAANFEGFKTEILRHGLCYQRGAYKALSKGLQVVQACAS